MLGRQSLDIGVIQDVKPFGIGLHQSVFDAVVDHLDEVARADRAGVDVALFDAWIAAIAPRRTRNVADPGGQRREDRIQPVDHRLVAPDHPTVAPIDAPDPPPGAAAHLMESAPFYPLAP